MSAPVSAMITSAIRVLIPGIVQIRSRNPRKGSITTSIRVGELLDRVGVLVDQVQVQPGQERVMLGEPPGQCLGQRRDLGPQPALGQLGQLGRVALARRSTPPASPAPTPR